jgi:hypothetical protein
MIDPSVTYKLTPSTATMSGLTPSGKRRSVSFDTDDIPMLVLFVQHLSGSSVAVYPTTSPKASPPIEEEALGMPDDDPVQIPMRRLQGVAMPLGAPSTAPTTSHDAVPSRKRTSKRKELPARVKPK